MSADKIDTIASLKYTALFTGSICILVLFLFTLAVHFGYNGQLAPRTWARPRQVLTNILKQPYGLSWIPWALNLSYHEMLEGIPGTGTRKAGHAGPLLKCNLDGIIILKFHALLLKVAIFATFCCCAIILPLNLTAICDPEISGEATCLNITNLDSYTKTTIANIPPMGFTEEKTANDDKQLASAVASNFVNYFDNDPGITSRLIAIVCITWAIYLYTCYLLWNEWIENSAWRRVYYLESEHYETRKRDLESLSNLAEDEESSEPQEELRPFLPNPEARETVPPIALYSALYKLPPCDVEYTIEEMLETAVDFFDKCIPNQPGFSSSVAACSILPDPSHIAQAWSLWYKCAKFVRKLRFIQNQLAQRRREQGLDDPEAQNSDNDEEVEQSAALSKKTLRIDTGTGDDDWELGLEALLLENNFETHAVFQREFAQSAQCCPNGVCCDGNIRKAGIDELLEMQEETRDQLRLAKKALLAVRAKGDPRNKRSIQKHDPMAKVMEPRLPGDENATANHRRGSLHFGRELRTVNEDLDFQESRNEKLRLRKTDIDSSNKADSGFLNGNDYTNFHERLRLRVDTDISNRADSGFLDGNDMPISSNRADPGLLNESDPALAFYDAQRPNRLWQIANQLVLNTAQPWGRGRTRHRPLSTGRWGNSWLKEKEEIIRPEKSRMPEIVQQEKYAIVTFTSRQAAVAARQCMADASGKDRWVEIDDIPTPPLADSPPFNILFCRGCCRPVTLTLNDSAKNARHNLTIVLMIVFCTLYTVPLSLTSTFFSASAKEQWPAFEYHSELQGLISGGLYTIFFSICPFIFKALANFGSNATSIRQAEYRALRYYWFFILVTAFAGNSLVSMVITGYFSRNFLEKHAANVLMDIAAAIPMLSDTWLNWIIIRFFFTLPVNYLLQFNTFLFNAKGFRGCSRCLAGSGAGGQLPYRLYCDAGLVFLCIVALGPVAPLLAPAGLIYFLVAVPIIRWTLIFVYRPVYDGGGMRWPLLHDIIISAMVLSQILLTFMMLLKQAHLPAVLAGIAIIPTINFSNTTKRRFKRAYHDSGLLQTSQLDAWDPNRSSTVETREEFRQWLVDGHRASFIPICLAGKDNILTWEPAVALLGSPRKKATPKSFESMSSPSEDHEGFQSIGSPQKGALFRRFSVDLSTGSFSVSARARAFSESASFDERGNSFYQEPSIEDIDGAIETDSLSA